MKKLFFVMLLVAAVGMAQAANTISVNCAEGSKTAPRAVQTVLAEEVAGFEGYATMNWNNIQVDDASGTELMDNAGNLTGSVMNFNVANGWGDAQADGSVDGANDKIARGYFDDTDTDNNAEIVGVDIEVTNVPYALYDVVLYLGTDASYDNWSPMTIDGQTLTGAPLRQFGDAGGWNLGQNVLVYTDLTGSTLDIELPARYFDDDGSARACLSGFQIVEVDPLLAFAPVPSNGENLADIATDLGWSIAPPIEGVLYNVYFGSDPNETSKHYFGKKQILSETTEVSYDLDPDLDNDQTYYWRIDALEPNDLDPGSYIVHSGQVWSFTTQPANVYVTVDPTTQTVAIGSQVELTGEGANASIYQWYKDGEVLAGATSSTLVIDSCQISDEGIYELVIDNELILPQTTAAARLMTQRLVGWWKMDGDLTDSVATVVDGAPPHDGTAVDPNFVTQGKDAGAYKLFGDAETIVTITNSVDAFNFYPNGFTLSAWVNTTQAGGWGAFISKQQESDSTAVPPLERTGFILTHNGGGSGVVTLRQSFNDVSGGSGVNAGQWHLVTGTYDAATGEGIVYVDGDQMNQSTNTTIVDESMSSLIFGAEYPDARVAFQGMLDDVKIWSYPLDGHEVAAIYTDYSPGEWVCVEHPEMDWTGPDTDGDGIGDPDCTVNIYELVDVAKSWLECDRVPTSSCN